MKKVYRKVRKTIRLFNKLDGWSWKVVRLMAVATAIINILVIIKSIVKW